MSINLSFDHIKMCCSDEGLCRITLDRAARANALTSGMLGDLCAALDQAEAAGARVVILTGAGRVFSAGADLDEVQGAGLATSPLWETLSSRIAGAEALTIAALNGTVAGGALGMVLAADLRLAVPSAEVFYPVIRRGQLPQPSDPGRLRALIGAARAKMMLLCGARIGAAMAADWGFVDEVCDDPLARAAELAADILAAPRAHVAAVRAMI